MTTTSLTLRPFAAAAFFVLCTSFAAAASADVPTTLMHQGRLYDASGQPINDTLPLSFALWDSPSGGAQLWTEVESAVAFDNGYYSVELGTISSLTPAFASNKPMFLGITVGNDAEMTPRSKIASVPFALISSEVLGDIHPHSITVGGVPVVDASGNWVGSATGLAGPTGPQGIPGPPGLVGVSPLVLYFPFNEGRGQIALDFGGRRLDGTLGLSANPEGSDPTWISDGRMGSALAFDGVSSCVRVPNGPELDFADGLTLSAWIRRTGSIAPVDGFGMIVAKHFTNNARAWDLHIDANTNQFGSSIFEPNNTAHIMTSSNEVATKDQWFHVASSYDRISGLQSLYVDGVLVNQQNIGSFLIQPTTVPTRVGCYNNAPDGSSSRAFFNGDIDEVMVFNRALGADKISALYLATP